MELPRSNKFDVYVYGAALALINPSKVTGCTDRRNDTRRFRRVRDVERSTSYNVTNRTSSFVHRRLAKAPVDQLALDRVSESLESPLTAQSTIPNPPATALVVSVGPRKLAGRSRSVTHRFGSANDTQAERVSLNGIVDTPGTYRSRCRYPTARGERRGSG